MICTGVHYFYNLIRLLLYFYNSLAFGITVASILHIIQSGAFLMSKSVLRKAVSMTAMFSFLYLAFSGVVLYFVPQGRIAYWADWRFLGMSKTMYGDTHTTISMLFLLTMVLHIWLNWKPVVNYMKNSSGALVVFTKETVLGLLLAVLFVAGTLMAFSPFSNIMMFLSDYKDDYEYTLGNPPYSHAELATLTAFVARMKLDKAIAFKLLDDEGIKYSENDTLQTIARDNSTKPAEIFEIIKPAKIKNKSNSSGVGDTSKYESMMGTGIGKKTVRAVAEKVGISVEEAIKRLRQNGVEAVKSDVLKELAGESGLTPMDIYIIIDSGVKPE